MRNYRAAHDGSLTRAARTRAQMLVHTRMHTRSRVTSLVPLTLAVQQLPYLTRRTVTVNMLSPITVNLQ